MQYDTIYVNVVTLILHDLILSKNNHKCFPILQHRNSYQNCGRDAVCVHANWACFLAVVVLASLLALYGKIIFLECMTSRSSYSNLPCYIYTVMKHTVGSFGSTGDLLLNSLLARPILCFDSTTCFKNNITLGFSYQGRRTSSSKEDYIMGKNTEA